MIEKIGQQKLIFILYALIIIAYFPAFFAGFTNWDDPAYIINNNFIKDLNMANLKTMFFDFHSGHYHPITWLSLAINYSFSGLEPFGYHLTNILLHAFNTSLVFFILKKLKFNNLISFSTAFVFGLHPLAVESVAWVTERKNVLYAFFYLSSILYYLIYCDNKKTTFYLITFLLFVLALLSKSMALVLPITLIIIDYYKLKNKFSIKIIVNKIPFLLLSFIFGILAVIAQSKVLLNEHVLNFGERIIWASWGFSMYIIKIFLPFNLSALYPYPLEPTISSIYYLGIIPVLMFLFLIYYFFIKKHFTALFSLLFFAVNIFFVLKIFNIPVGPYYMADRYTYLPIIGIALAFFSYLNSTKLINSKIIYPTLSLVALLLVVSSFKRSHVWKDSVTLWTDVINKHENATTAYINRGNAYRDIDNFNFAINDYNKAEEINPAYFQIYANRGYVYSILNNHEKAINDFSKSIKLMPSYYQAYHNKGLSLYKLHKHRDAIIWLTKAIEIKPDYTEAYIIRGNAFYALNKNDSALIDYDKAILYNPKNATGYFNKANILAMNNNHKDAIKYYDVAIFYDNTNSEIFMNRANSKYYLNDFNGAINDFTNSILINPKNIQTLMNRGTLYLRIGNYQNAYNDFTNIINFEPKNSEAWLKRGMTLINSDKPKDSCKDFNVAYDLKNPLAKSFLIKYCN